MNITRPTTPGSGDTLITDVSYAEQLADQDDAIAITGHDGTLIKLSPDEAQSLMDQLGDALAYCDYCQELDSRNAQEFEGVTYFDGNETQTIRYFEGRRQPKTESGRRHLNWMRRNSR